MRNSLSVALLAVLAISAVPVFGANPSIGIATSVGSVSVNELSVTGSTDLADGSRLQTTSAPSEVHLSSGADVRLGTRSAGTFYADHVSLEQGAVRVGSFNGLTVSARQLQIAGDEPGSEAIVRMNRKTIEVASLGGAVNVMDSGLLTRVAAGTKMSFQAGQTPDQSATTNTGAAPKPARKMPSDEKTFLWVIGITAVAALAIGLTAAAEGKSPF